MRNKIHQFILEVVIPCFIICYIVYTSHLLNNIKRIGDSLEIIEKYIST